MLEACPLTTRPAAILALTPPPCSAASPAPGPRPLHPGHPAPDQGGLGGWRERLAGLSLLVWRGRPDSVVSTPVTRVKARARRKAWGQGARGQVAGRRGGQRGHPWGAGQGRLLSPRAVQTSALCAGDLLMKTRRKQMQTLHEAPAAGAAPAETHAGPRQAPVVHCPGRHSPASPLLPGSVPS